MQVLGTDIKRAALKTGSHFLNMPKEEQHFQYFLNFFNVNIVNKKDTFERCGQHQETQCSISYKNDTTEILLKMYLTFFHNINRVVHEAICVLVI
jgi:hypothetical protein